MKRFSSAKFLFAATVATAALGAATVAEARPDVTLAIGFQTGPAWVQPAPVYVQPRPVYVQPRVAYVPPAPVFVRPPVHVAPRVVVERPGWRDDARFERERERAWRHAEWRRHGWRDAYRGFDRDGDRGERKYHHDGR